MRLIKVLGLAAVAAFTAMAFLGTGSAFAAKKDSVVICDQLVEKGKLCPAGHLWLKGTIILALAELGALTAGGLEVKCEDSIVEATTLADSGLSLPFEITRLVFGKLPTPTLGEGCEGGCKKIHTKTDSGGTYAGSITVTGEDEFHFTSKGSAQLLECLGSFTCEYGSESILSLPITHDGTHPSHEGSNLPRITIHTTLKKTGGSFFCPSEGTWETHYVITLLHYNVVGKEKLGLGWPALDNPVIEF